MTRPPQPDAEYESFDCAMRALDHQAERDARLCRRVGLALAIVLVVALLAGCGGGDPEPLTPDECKALAGREVPPGKQPQTLPPECTP